MVDGGLSDLFKAAELDDTTNFTGVVSPENLFGFFDSIEDVNEEINIPFSPYEDIIISPRVTAEQLANIASGRGSRPSSLKRAHETNDGGDEEGSLNLKKIKLSLPPPPPGAQLEAIMQDGQQKISHITVERNRRKQMNEHLSVLRSLMPSFYVKRGDQASIIGGVVDYVKELQQLLQSLEAKKQRKVYSEVLSPRPVSSPRPSPILSPRPPSLSPRISVPISPRTPQPGSPYKPRIQQPYLSPPPLMPPSSHQSSSPSIESISSTHELVASSKSQIAEVEVKFSGPNLLLKTISHRMPGQALKIIATLEGLSLEILHVSISTIDDNTMLNSFTIKIGIECELSVEELAQEIQQTFS